MHSSLPLVAMPLVGTRQLPQISRLLREVAMIIMDSSNLHSSRYLEVLVPLLTMLILTVTISHHLLDTVKAKVILRMDMVDIMHLLLNLVMVKPNQTQFQVTISNKAIIQPLDTPTHLLMAIHLRMELKAMLAKLQLVTLPLLVSRVTQLVSNPVPIPTIPHKVLLNLGMACHLLPKADMVLSHLPVMVKVMDLLRLKSLLPVNKLMCSPSNHQVPKEVMVSLVIRLLNPVVMHSQILLVPSGPHHLGMGCQLLSQDMVPHLMEHHQCPNLIMGSSRHRHTTVDMELVTRSLLHILQMEIQVEMHGQHMTQHQHRREFLQVEV